MALPLATSFDGGANGATLTSGPGGNTATSGSYFDLVTIGSGGSIVFSAGTGAHGSMAAKVATTTSAGSYIGWSTSFGTQATHYGRAYFYLAALGANDVIVAFKTGSGSWNGGIQVTSAGALRIQLPSFSYAATFATTIAATTQYRLEWKLVCSATVGQIIVSLYAGDSATALETYTGPATQNWGANCTAVWFGWPSANANQPALYLDDLGLSATGYLGPSGVTATPGTLACTSSFPAPTVTVNTAMVGVYLGGGMGSGGTGITYTAANAMWQAWTGISNPVARYYLAASQFGYQSNMAQMVAAGTKICLTVRPAYNPVSAADLASLDTLMATLQAAGADVEVALWHEPYYQGLTSAQFIAMWNYYAPTVRNYYPAVFVPNVASLATHGEGAYYPGDALVDKVAVDIYDSQYKTGQNMSAAAAIADGASPPKPFGIWEFDGSTDPYNGQSQADVGTFFAYVQSFMLARLTTGKVNADIILFPSLQSNWLGNVSTPNCGMTGGIGNWAMYPATGNCSVAPSAVAHSPGSGSMAMTSLASGAMMAYCALGGTGGQPVTAGSSIAGVQAWVRASTVTRTCQVNLLWYNSSGTYLSASSGTPVTSSTSVWTQLSLSGVTAPATAAFALPEVQVNGAGGVSEVHYVTDVTLWVSASTSPAQCNVLIYGWDYRIGLWQTLYSALNGAPITGANVVPATVTAAAGWTTPTVSGSGQAGGYGAVYTASYPAAAPVSSVTAVLATGTGAALSSAFPLTGLATGTGTALTSAFPQAGAATGAGTAQNAGAGAAASVTAVLATAAGTSQSASPPVPAGLASGAGAAQNATAATAASGTATAIAATGAGAAQSTAFPPAVLAAGTGTAQGPAVTAATSVTAGLATSAGAALSSAFPLAVAATGTGAALTPAATSVASAAAGLAAATGAARSTAFPLAGTATGAGAAQNAAASTTTSGTAAAIVATAAGAATSTAFPLAAMAAGTGAAQNAAAIAAFTVTAGLAAGIGAALSSAFPLTSAATGAGTGQNATAITVSSGTATAIAATGTGAAQTTAFPLTGLATGTGAAQSPAGTAAATAAAILATGTGAAPSSTFPLTSAATGAGTARNAAAATTTAGSAAAIVATAAAAAQNANPPALVTLATGTGTAQNATAATAAFTNAQAGLATATATAINAATLIPVTVATGTGTAQNATAAAGAKAIAATGTGATAARLGAAAGLATGTGTAQAATAALAYTAQATAATALAAALNVTTPAVYGTARQATLAIPRAETGQMALARAQ